MIKVTVKVDGMMCGMCEAHIRDTIRKAFPDAKKVTASRRSGEAAFLSEIPADEEILKKAVEATGYTFVSVSSQPYRKWGQFSGKNGNY